MDGTKDAGGSDGIAFLSDFPHHAETETSPGEGKEVGKIAAGVRATAQARAWAG